MKKIFISGSLAYDRIMNFPESFSDHILPDKIHDLNVCFLVDGVTENFGGTAGNIAYALKLMGDSPTITATIGRDNQNYFDWLTKHSITCNEIKAIETELTAGAYITTDQNNNQITCFNPGAMNYSSDLDFEGINPEESLLLISPGFLGDMVNYPKMCKEKGVPYIFDPGQQLPVLPAADLIAVITDCMLLIVNDYEFNLIMDKTGLKKDELLKLPKATIITLGGSGSELYQHDKKVNIPSFKAAQVVDPTGAGDAYRGGLLSGLVSGKNLVESATLGSICASFAVECKGTQVYTFTLEEFQNRKKAD